VNDPSGTVQIQKQTVPADVTRHAILASPSAAAVASCLNCVSTESSSSQRTPAVKKYAYTSLSLCECVCSVSCLVARTDYLAHTCPTNLINFIQVNVLRTTSCTYYRADFREELQCEYIESGSLVYENAHTITSLSIKRLYAL